MKKPRSYPFPIVSDPGRHTSKQTVNDIVEADEYILIRRVGTKAVVTGECSAIFLREILKIDALGKALKNREEETDYLEELAEQSLEVLSKDDVKKLLNSLYGKMAK